MEDMKQGKFSDEIIEQTKAVIENQLLETIDQPIGLIEVLYHNIVSPVHVEIDEWLERNKKVTKEEIMEIINKQKQMSFYMISNVTFKDTIDIWISDRITSQGNPCINY